ncbi:TPA: O-antigen polymerase, partial [Escherichia coli]
MLVIAWYSIFLLISATGMTGLNKLSTEAILCYIAFLFCFFFGMMLGGVSLPNGMKMLQQEQKIKKRHASAIVLIYCFFIFYSLIALLNIYYFNKVDLSSYRQAFFDGSRDNVKYFYGVFGFYFYYLLSLLVFALVPYTIITNSKKTISLCFFALLLYDIIFLSRTGVYYFILSYIVSSILLKKGIKKIIIVGMVALLFSLIMSYTRDMKSDIIGTLFSSIINYHIAPFVLFDENIISNHLIKYNGAGLASLGIYNIIFYPIDSSIMSSINDFRAQLNEF